MQVGRQAGRQADRHAGGQTGRQADRQTWRQRDAVPSSQLARSAAFICVYLLALRVEGAEEPLLVWML